MRQTFKTERFGIIILLLLIAAVLVYAQNTEEVPWKALTRNTDTHVAFVIDGDTFELENGERVRLVGINTPKAGEPHFSSARNALHALIDDKEVHLERDVTDRDKYGRLLRLVWVKDVFINLTLVEEGWASSSTIPPDTTYQERFSAAEQEAFTAKRGIWEPRPEQSEPIIVADFHPNAAGDDNTNLNDEYVVLKNISGSMQELSGWNLQDGYGHTFTFPTLSLAPGAEITLYTGSGDTSPTTLYWGRQEAAVWNNTGDTLYLYTPDGEQALRYAY